MNEAIKEPLQMLSAVLFAMGVGWLLGYKILSEEQKHKPEGPNVGRVIFSHDSTTWVGILTYTVTEPGVVQWDTLYTTNDTAWLPYHGGYFVNYMRHDSIRNAELEYDRYWDSLAVSHGIAIIPTNIAGVLSTTGGSGWTSTRERPKISAGKGIIITGNGSKESPYRISLDPFYVDSVAWRYGSAVRIPKAVGSHQTDSISKLYGNRLVIYDTLVKDTLDLKEIK